jgi:hypothetical protein
MTDDASVAGELRTRRLTVWCRECSDERPVVKVIFGFHSVPWIEGVCPDGHLEPVFNPNHHWGGPLWWHLRRAAHRIGRVYYALRWFFIGHTYHAGRKHYSLMNALRFVRDSFFCMCYSCDQRRQHVWGWHSPNP